MRITFVSPQANMGGGTRVIGIYAENLAAMGHDVQIFSIQYPRPGSVEQLKSLLKGNGFVPWVPCTNSHLDGKPIAHRVLNHSGPVTDCDLPDADVVIATWWETAPWVAALSRKKGAKAYFMQDYGAQGQEIDRISATWHLPLQIITISEWLAKLIRKHCGNIDVVVVPNSVDLELFHAPRRKKQVVPTMGLVYRTLSSKGIDIALDAVRAAQKVVPDLNLIAYGPEKLSPDLPLPEGTTYYLQPQDAQLPEIYSSCDAWIFPSRKEGFGLPILEAMASRTPVIATDAGAAPELVNSQNGFLILDEDHAAMADAILKVANLDETGWGLMSDSAYARASGYTWEDATTLFEAGLRKSLDREVC